MSGRAAKTILYRHSCDCATASRALHEDEHPEHRFDVDGEPFPFLLTEQGACFHRVEDLYYVYVVIVLIDPNTQADIPFRHMRGEYPFISGVMFPWTLAAPIKYTGDDNWSRVALTFIAENVDADKPIPVYLNKEAIKPMTPHSYEPASNGICIYCGKPFNHPNHSESW